MKKKIVISISFIVDEENQEGVRKFHDAIAAFNDQLKADFDDDVQDFKGQIDIECVHNYKWVGGGNTPDGPTEPEKVCEHCGAICEDD